jgi:ATP synthase subunit 6
MINFFNINLLFITYKIGINSPIDQFETIQISSTCAYDIIFYIIDKIHINNIFIILICIYFILKWRNFLSTQITLISSGFISIDSSLELLVISILKNRNRNFIDITIILFSLILFLNCIALIPFVQGLTSQLIFTLILTLISLFTIWFQNFFSNKIFIFNHFLPEGSPTIILPFIIFIELIANLSRIISLSVRLFANITSGHVLSKIIAGFGLLTITFNTVWKLAVLPPIFILCLTSGLEIIIAILQSYVFVSLIIIYIAEGEEIH